MVGQWQDHTLARTACLDAIPVHYLSIDLTLGPNVATSNKSFFRIFYY